MYKFILSLSTLFIAYILSLTTISAQQFSYEWAKSFGGIKSESASTITMDNQGYIYMAGYSYGDLSFGSSDLSGPVDLIAKLDSEGNTIWATGIFNASTMFSGVAIDSEYNVYVSGYFTGTFEFNSEIIESHGFHDVFVAKYDSNGTPLWVRAGGGEGYENRISIAIDSEDNLYLLSHFGSPTFTIHDTVLTNDGGMKGVICKFDGAGEIIWIKDVESYWVSGLAIDAVDNIYIGGDFYELEFGNSFLTSHPEAYGAACFIVYDKNGQELWGKCAGGEDDSYTSAYSLVIDNSGNIYVIGTYDSEITFDDLILPSPPADPDYPDYNLEFTFIAKYSAEGDIQWATKIEGDIYFKSIKKSNSGFYFLGEAFSPTVELGSISLEGDEDEGIIFFSKLSLDGEFLWAFQFEDDLDINTCAINSQNDIFIAGSFDNDINLNGTLLTNAGERDIFLAKLVESSVGIKMAEESKQTFNLYPNPFSNHAVLHAEKELYHATLTVTNIVGQVVQKMDNLQGNEVIIDRKNLSPGIYFVNVFEKDQILVSKKIVVQ